MLLKKTLEQLAKRNKQQEKRTESARVKDKQDPEGASLLKPEQLIIDLVILEICFSRLFLAYWKTLAGNQLIKFRHDF